MGMEIERKFLAIGDAWRKDVRGKSYCQGYLSRSPGRTVRVRIEGEEARLTIKGPMQGISRLEFEYPIPLNDAKQMQGLCTSPLVIKTRYVVPHDGRRWEIDEFHGENEGLVIAEIELDRTDDVINLPPWIGKEVSGDTRYCNSNLSIHPYRSW